MTARDPGDWKSFTADRLIRIHAAVAGRQAALAVKAIDKHCESPIEKMLAATFVCMGHLPKQEWPKLDFDHGLGSSLDDLVIWFYDVVRDGLRSPLYGGLEGTWVSMIRPQVGIGPYRVDFALVAVAVSHDADDPKKMPLLKIAIECDGHDFHERTKEQAAHDRARDRYLQAAGLTVLRFTGSEIWRSAEGCRDEIISHVKQWAVPIIQRFDAEFLALPLKVRAQDAGNV